MEEPDMYVLLLSLPFQILPAGCLVQQLVEWVCWHGRDREGAWLQEVLSHPPPEEHRDYWRMLYRLVLTGRLSEARNLLTQHSAAASMERVRLLWVSIDRETSSLPPFLPHSLPPSLPSSLSSPALHQS